MAVSALPVATLVIFIILVHPLIYCIWKHGKAGLLGWMIIQVFCTVLIVGSILSIRDEVNGTTSTATLIFNNVGLSPLLLGTLGVLHEARTARDPGINFGREWLRVFAYHGAVIVGMVLIIVGIVQEISNKDPTPTTTVKVGVIILLLTWVVLFTWTAMSLRHSRRDGKIIPAWPDATALIYTLLAVLPLIGLRVMYAVLHTFPPTADFNTNFAAQVVLITVPEMLIALIYVVMGIKTRHIGYLRKKEVVVQASSLGLQSVDGEHKDGVIVSHHAH